MSSRMSNHCIEVDPVVASPEPVLGVRGDPVSRGPGSHRVGEDWLAGMSKYQLLFVFERLGATVRPRSTTPPFADQELERRKIGMQSRSVGCHDATLAVRIDETRCCSADHGG